MPPKARSRDYVGLGRLLTFVGRVWSRRLFLLFSAFFAADSFASVEPHPLADQLLIVANGRVQASVEVANYYAEQRGIAKNRILVLDMPEQETISRAAFNRSIHNPLIRALEERGFMELVLEAAPEDPSERQGYSVVFNRLRYMVLCYGVPLRVSRVPDLDETEAVQRFLRLHGRTRPDLAREEFFQGRLAANHASVDSELAALPIGLVPVTGMVGNPVFRQAEPGILASQVLRVTRLDGPTPDDARRLVDQAIEGERLGLRGRAYFDLDGREEGGYRIGNDWLRAAHRAMEMAAFDTTVDTRREIMPLRQRFDTPVFYLGWYAHDVDGVFQLPDFAFPPGAIAVHIHSFSARTLRDPEAGWVAPFVHRGVTATVGNVFEPFLLFSHHVDALTVALLNDWTWGDAAYFATPVLSWQGIVIGDPLYRPFAVPLETQMERIRTEGWDGHDTHILLRAANRLRQQGQAEAARDAIEGAFAENPHPSLGLYLVEMFSDHRSRDDRHRILRRMAEEEVAPANSHDWGLFVALADIATRERFHPEAITLYRRVLEQPAMTDAFAREILGDASRAAASGGNLELSTLWRDQLMAILRSEEPVESAPADNGNP